MQPLKGRIAVVAGATRGAGRGIAVMLGAAGATVYCTGRSIRGHPATGTRPETIEETADLVTAQGGTGIAVQVDHTLPDQVKALFERIQDEQAGQLDVLVNDVWGGDALTEWGKRLWEHSLTNGLLLLERAVFSHLITSHYGIPLMVARRQGLVIEITDGVRSNYRGNMFYSLAKISTIHIADGLAKELHKYTIAAVALTPGYLRSGVMLEGFGVSESNWQEAIQQDPLFADSETPFYVGRAVVALATDPSIMKKSGQVLSSGHLAREYGFTDIDGRLPPGYD